MTASAQIVASMEPGYKRINGTYHGTEHTNRFAASVPQSQGSCKNFASSNVMCKTPLYILTINLTLSFE